MKLAPSRVLGGVFVQRLNWPLGARDTHRAGRMSRAAKNGIHYVSLYDRISLLHIPRLEAIAEAASRTIASFPNNLGTKRIVRALLQGSSPGNFLEEA